MMLECPGCKSKPHKVIDYTIKSEVYITHYRCVVCQMEWSIKRSLVSDGDGYRSIYFKRKNIPLHRLVYERYYNEILGPGDIIHHINLIKRDNRPKNLLRIDRSKHHSDKSLHWVELKNKIYHLEQTKCKRCGHIWIPRKNKKPIMCPCCKSLKWEIPKNNKE